MQGLLSGVVLGRLSDYWGRFPCYLTALMCEVCESGPFKQPFIYLKPIILPRQARGKHRESTQKTYRFLTGRDGVGDCNWVQNDLFLSLS